MSRARRVPGRGAAMARQMGLVLDAPPEGVSDGAELEQELLELLGEPQGAPGRVAPTPPQGLAAVGALAQLCLRDPPEEDEEEEEEEELEDEEELLAELQEVLQEGDGSEATTETPQEPSGPAVLSVLSERLDLYREAAGNARDAGDGARLRRLQRGLRTLEQMLESVRSGKSIDEAEIPPPVALGKGGRGPAQAPPGPPDPPAQPPSPSMAPSPDPCPDPCPDPDPILALRARLRELQREALLAKRRGDTATALGHYRAAKSLEAQLEAQGQGRAPGPEPEEPKDPARKDPARKDPAPKDPAPKDPAPKDPAPKDPALKDPAPKDPAPKDPAPKDPPVPRDPPAPPAPGAPPAPRDVREALEQRMERYRAAAAQAKESGDGRKVRMHERIVKQYQAALRALSAGKAVDLSELPVPPGFPPIQGSETPAEPSMAGMLEAATRLAGTPQEEEEEEEEEEGGIPEGPKPDPRPAPLGPPKQPPRNAPSGGTPNSQPAPKPTGKAQAQLEFLELRRAQFSRAALRAKRRNDLGAAKELLRRAKGVEGLLGAARGGLPVDLAQVPEPPLDGTEFELGPGGVPVPPETTKTFLQLAGALRKQHQMCLTYSRQFAHLGNISETTRCEALAEECRRHMETLRRAHNRGAPPPRPRYEHRTFSVIKMFPELSSSDLELGIERGIGLPVPPGVAATDLDTFVRFEFPHPSAEEAQRDKTPVVKSTDCPEFGARFRLRLLRGHRGLRRLLSSRGIKFEVVQKGGLFRPERALGSAQLRLQGLESSCELRGQLELLDGRRPTGGRLEVWVRIREPLGSHRELEPRSERWMVLEPGNEAQVAAPKPAPAAPKDGNNRSLPTFPSLNLLLFERERLERKMVPFSRGGLPVPPELRQQHQELLRRIQGLRTRLQGGDPQFRSEYLQQLQRHLQLYTAAARRLGTEGQREAAKEALYKRNLVESEIQKLRG